MKERKNNIHIVFINLVQFSSGVWRSYSLAEDEEFSTNNAQTLKCFNSRKIIYFNLLGDVNFYVSTVNSILTEFKDRQFNFRYILTPFLIYLTMSYCLAQTTWLII